MCKPCFDAEGTSKYEQMIEKIIEESYQRKGMKDAGWKETPDGVMYYPDDDNPNILHLSY